ncbi:putative Zn finger protein [Saccharopolyspora lacisalsi]|uniref:Putative Zn finger protein n=2 Tax=Halosaccharopolyspora lacisalsi TaxID=1000566 RepID=A0A839DTU8_9PSEU|nr:putative Zn finger protein [Halosaccharopolyspora lacisalsi]
MSDEFGTTAWGRDWLRLAEPTSIIRPDPALPRARSLARNDRVHDLDATTGLIEATVRDRSRHRVRITVPIWDEPLLAKARTVLADQPVGGDLNDSVHTALKQAGLTLAPDPATRTATCDCTSRKDPCVHLLATYVEFARRLDERPRLALVLRGLTTSDTPGEITRIPLGLVEVATFYGTP